MNNTLYAYTKPDSPYPGYVNIEELSSGDIKITIRSGPRINTDGCYVCGYARDKGKHGRCTPGDENCNNYCNMAPEKGVMADTTKPVVYHHEGETAMLIVDAEVWAEITGSNNGT